MGGGEPRSEATQDSMVILQLTCTFEYSYTLASCPGHTCPIPRPHPHKAVLYPGHTPTRLSYTRATSPRGCPIPRPHPHKAVLYPGHNPTRLSYTGLWRWYMYCCSTFAGPLSLHLLRLDDVGKRDLSMGNHHWGLSLCRLP